MHRPPTGRDFGTTVSIVSALTLFGMGCTEGAEDSSDAGDLHSSDSGETGALPASSGGGDSTNSGRTSSSDEGGVTSTSADDSTPPLAEQVEDRGPHRGAFFAHFVEEPGCPFSATGLQIPADASNQPVSGSAHSSWVEAANPQPFVNCEYYRDPTKFILNMRVVENGVGVSVSLAPPLSTSEESQHALRVESGDKVATSASELCSFRAIEIADDFSSVWGKLSCPSLDAWDGDDDVRSCTIDEGYFYFENCMPRVAP